MEYTEQVEQTETDRTERIEIDRTDRLYRIKQMENTNRIEYTAIAGTDRIGRKYKIYRILQKQTEIDRIEKK